MSSREQSRDMRTSSHNAPSLIISLALTSEKTHMAQSEDEERQLVNNVKRESVLTDRAGQCGREQAQYGV